MCSNSYESGCGIITTATRFRVCLTDCFSRKHCRWS